MSMIYDHIVVGSGMTGAHASQTLLEANCHVLMLDVGIQNPYQDRLPLSDFVSLRSKDTHQSDYFLGKNFEGIPWAGTKHTLTPPRQFILERIDDLLPLQAKDFIRMESLSYGGLGNGWGAGCAVYTDDELTEMGLPLSETKEAYQVIADRIGIAAEKNDVSIFCGNNLKPHCPPIKRDKTIERVFRNYLKNKVTFNRNGVWVGQMPMAVLTNDLDERKALPYFDMEFWSDQGQSVYRPWMTVNKLKKNSLFEYRDHALVLRYQEKEDKVFVEIFRTDLNIKETLICRKLVLATGTLSSARIVLRSGAHSQSLPILTNPYSLVACLQWQSLGKAHEQYKTSMGQLEVIYTPKDQPLQNRMTSLYTYRSLLLFKLIKEIPLGLSMGLGLVRALQSSLVIAAINHPDFQSPRKSISLVPDQSQIGDHLKVSYEVSAGETKSIESAEKIIKKSFLKLGCLPLSHKKMEAGSTVHYAGSLPFSGSEKPNTLSPDGRLHGTRNVFVADGSGFRYLPANGLTFTLMANAHRVAKKLAKGQSN